MKLPHWLALIALVSAITLLWSLKGILIQIFAGIVLAMALSTLIEKLRSKQSMPRPIALIICLIAIIFISGVFLAIVVPPFTKEFQQLINQLPAAGRELSDLAIGSFNKISEIIYYGEKSEGKQLTKEQRRQTRARKAPGLLSTPLRFRFSNKF